MLFQLYITSFVLLIVSLSTEAEMNEREKMLNWTSHQNTRRHAIQDRQRIKEDERRMNEQMNWMTWMNNLVPRAFPLKNGWGVPPIF